MEKLSKVKNNIDSDFKRQTYFESKNILESRTMFKLRTGMFPCKMNFRSDYSNSKELWMCDSCESQIDSLSHVMICPAYSKLRREGKDVNSDKNVVTYLVEVMKIRERMGFRK